MPAERLALPRADVRSVEAHRALAGLPQPNDKARKRRLARRTWAEHAQRLAGRKQERHASDGLASLVVHETDVLGGERALGWGQRQRGRLWLRQQCVESAIGSTCLDEALPRGYRLLDRGNGPREDDRCG